MITRSLLSVSGCRGPRQDRLSSLFRHRIIVCVPLLFFPLFLYSYLLFRYTHPIFHSTPSSERSSGVSSGFASLLAKFYFVVFLCHTCLAFAFVSVLYRILQCKIKRDENHVRILTKLRFQYKETVDRS